MLSFSVVKNHIISRKREKNKILLFLSRFEFKGWLKKSVFLTRVDDKVRRKTDEVVPSN